MKIYGTETNEIIIQEIGKRIKSRRISLSITQKELSRESGVSLRTIINVENGENISLKNLLSISRVLRVIENFELLIPESKTDPFEILELGHKRKRVTSVIKDKPSGWKWGDEE